MSNYTYITFDKLISTALDDLELFNANKLVNRDQLLKVISYCNGKLGNRIHQTKTCTVPIRDHVGQVPADLHKIQVVFGTFVEKDYGTNIIFQRTFEENGEPYVLDEYPEKACLEEQGGCFWVSKNTLSGRKIRIEQLFPLELGHGIRSRLMPMSPNHAWRGEYQADMDEQLFHTSFKDGEIYIEYLGILEDEDGNMLIPFDNQLYPYYEWSVKKKILEDVMMKSDADVSRKLAYAKEEVPKAYLDAFNSVMTISAKDGDAFRKKNQMAFYNKYVKLFKPNH